MKRKYMKNDFVKHWIANRIWQVREDVGISRSELADFLGVDTTIVCRFENGKISITAERLLRIAEFLEVPPSQLLGEEA